MFKLIKQLLASALNQADAAKEPEMKAKVLVLYYSTYGHTEHLANAIADGARSGGAEATVKRVPELMPPEVARQAGAKTEQTAPIANPEELADYDAIIIGTPTRFGRVAAQVANFLDQTGGLWAGGKLIGKVGGAFVSTASQHGGAETTLFSILTSLMHHGMITVGLPYSFSGLTRMDEVTGGAPYGATTLAGVDGARQPSENELAGARFQGRHIAEVTTTLLRGRNQ
ncbi:NAD(P)H dehydrogenase (quinone) [Cupriavidus yeoncheonensis]|uniref:NAD(P)H dehydrogenase (quinone) n=2 Tax=Cupriavidus yeoncheonensis TaxID=1462994 RepID=A0A916N6M2_9BURK|nr:NAD(P)H dehydrogenase (quinone) [Cupriavidus yeoncheonensis]